MAEQFAGLHGHGLGHVYSLPAFRNPAPLIETDLVSQGRSRHPVLQGDAIVWRNIDGPRSLMTAWKKLVTTSAFFGRESSDFL